MIDHKNVTESIKGLKIKNFSLGNSPWNVAHTVEEILGRDSNTILVDTKREAEIREKIEYFDLDLPYYVQSMIIDNDIHIFCSDFFHEFEQRFFFDFFGITQEEYSYIWWLDTDLYEVLCGFFDRVCAIILDIAIEEYEWDLANNYPPLLGSLFGNESLSRTVVTILAFFYDQEKRYEYLFRVFRCNPALLVWELENMYNGWFLNMYADFDKEYCVKLFDPSKCKNLSDALSKILVLEELWKRARTVDRIMIEKLQEAIYQWFNNLAIMHYSRLIMDNHLDVNDDLSRSLDAYSYPKYGDVLQISREYWLINRDWDNFWIWIDIIPVTAVHINPDGLVQDEFPYYQLFANVPKYFMHNPNNNKDNRFLVRLIHNIWYLSQIEEAIGIDFSDYPFSIQPHFLTFLAYATLEDMEQVKVYLSHGKDTNDKYNRLRVFLAVGEGREFGDLILKIDSQLVEQYGKEIGSAIGNQVFAKYADIMTIVEEDVETIKREYFGADANVKFSKQKHVRELMIRANSILESLDRAIGNHLSIEQFERVVCEYDTELVQFGSLFRIAEKDGTQSLETTMWQLGVKYRRITGDKMQPSDREKIWNLYETNYATNPIRDKLLPFIRSGLENDFQNSQARFHLFEYHNTCLLSVKFVEQPDGSIYFWAFNSEPQFQSYSFGSFVFEKLLSEYNGRKVHGLIIKGNEYLLPYYRRYGFEPERNLDWSLVIENKEWIEFCHIVRTSQTEIPI
jgi:hypothetical protein